MAIKNTEKTYPPPATPYCRLCHHKCKLIKYTTHIHKPFLRITNERCALVMGGGVIYNTSIHPSNLYLKNTIMVWGFFSAFLSVSPKKVRATQNCINVFFGKLL